MAIQPCFVVVPGACSGERVVLAAGKGEDGGSLEDCTGDGDYHGDLDGDYHGDWDEDLSGDWVP